MNDLIAIDFETGGLVPGVHAPLALGACTMAGSKFRAFILPERGLKVDPEAVAKNGYTPEKWRKFGARPLAEVVAEFMLWVGVEKKSGAWRPLAHNATFDRGFFDWMCRYCSVRIPLSYHWECSMSTMAALHRAKVIQVPGYKLDDLCALAGLQGRAEAHDALWDAKACLMGYAWMQEWLKAVMCSFFDLRMIRKLLSPDQGSQEVRIEHTGMDTAIITRVLRDHAERGPPDAPKSSSTPTSNA